MVDEGNPGIWKRRPAGIAVFSGNRLSTLE